MIGSRFQADHNRKMLVQDVKDMLKLMSIEYQTKGPFKLRVVPQQEIEARKNVFDDLSDLTGILTYHQGLAVTQARGYARILENERKAIKLGYDLASKTDRSAFLWGHKIKIGGESADMIIMDDITYDDAFIQSDPTKKP